MRRIRVLAVGLATLLTCVGVSSAAQLTIVLGADNYEGPPHFQVIVNGALAKEGDVTTPDQEITFSIPDGAAASIAFTNDLAAPRETRMPGQDRNLVIQSVSVDGAVTVGAELPHTVGAVRGNTLVLFENALLTLPTSRR